MAEIVSPNLIGTDQAAIAQVFGLSQDGEVCFLTSPLHFPVSGQSNWEFPTAQCQRISRWSSKPDFNQSSWNR
jgi:hypothetical protein